MMTWRARFNFRCLTLYLHVRTMATQGEMATDLTAPLLLTLVFILDCKEPVCPHVDDPVRKPRLYLYPPLLLCGHPLDLGIFTLVVWSLLRAGEEVHIGHEEGLVLFGQ